MYAESDWEENTEKEQEVEKSESFTQTLYYLLAMAALLNHDVLNYLEIHGTSVGSCVRSM